ncbi:endolytic transglycosylase MltG [Conexibacter sp. W3-3-2]|uniref:endolytic transglycosylase MltG n=1 Tax=Conexibacter sp. W3-3-2 TaxID=2675227 RepID=UPI0012B9A989|nr:endolytic transglycosylase MltG [Conexibacter sp. W3-3-2]MTD42933.1 endolytic transglycosylase MltG [Conexibacter sp. W3-3-2]
MGLFGGKGDTGGGPRDAHERERARLEREVRRAERAGERPAADVLARLAELDGASARAAAPAPAPPVAEPTAPPVADPAPAAEVPPTAAPQPDWFDGADTPAPPAPPVAREQREPTPPPVPEPAVPPAPEPTARREPEPVEWAQDTGTWDVPDRAPAGDGPEPTFGRDEPAPPMTPEPAPIAPARRRSSVPPPPRRPQRIFTDEHDALPASARYADEDDDAPVGVRRVSEAQAAAAAGTPGGPARPARPAGAPAAAFRRPRRLAVRLVGVVLLLVIGAGAWFANALWQPFAGDGGDRVTVRIPEGASASEIGDLLAERGVVDSGFFFSLRARMSGDRDKLRAATFTTLREGMTYEAALAELTKPVPVVRTITVTVPEGRSRRETVPIIRESGLRGGYLNATKKVDGFSPRRLYGAPSGVRDLEGFLFPATYELRKGANVKDLVAKQLEAFQEQFATLDLRAARAKNLSAYDVLIIASMIEREAALDKERSLISGVIYNRLKQGIPLGIDATIRFRLNQWTQPLKVSELNIDSDYNTRTRQGLPPGPIGNPGIKSLRAAAKPAKTKALYYVVKPCGNGAHAFSATDAEFQEDVAAYNRERDKRGGRDPSRC